MEKVYEATTHRRGSQVAHKLIRCDTSSAMRTMQIKQQRNSTDCQNKKTKIWIYQTPRKLGLQAGVSNRTSTSPSNPAEADDGAGICWKGCSVITVPAELSSWCHGLPLQYFKIKLGSQCPPYWIFQSPAPTMYTKLGGFVKRDTTEQTIDNLSYPVTHKRIFTHTTRISACIPTSQGPVTMWFPVQNWLGWLHTFLLKTSHGLLIKSVRIWLSTMWISNFSLLL